MARVDLNPQQWMDHPALARETHTRLSQEGILLASLDAEGKLNPMTIGWGVFGWIWSRPIFTVLVRPSRYTCGCIEATGDFTVNVQPADRRNIAEFCGSVSGREHDKMAVLNLSPLPSRRISSPGIAECPIVFECEVVYRQEILSRELSDDIKSQHYAEGDFHRVYFGHILAISVEQELFEGLKGGV